MNTTGPALGKPSTSYGPCQCQTNPLLKSAQVLNLRCGPMALHAQSHLGCASAYDQPGCMLQSSGQRTTSCRVDGAHVTFLCRRVLSLLKLPLNRTTQPGPPGPVSVLGEHGSAVLTSTDPKYGTPYLPTMFRCLGYIIGR